MKDDLEICEWCDEEIEPKDLIFAGLDGFWHHACWVAEQKGLHDWEYKFKEKERPAEVAAKKEDAK